MNDELREAHLRQNPTRVHMFRTLFRTLNHRVALDRPTDRPSDRPTDRPTDRVSFILVRVYALVRLFVSLDNLCLQYELL